jgi:ATP-binding cassette, subfamily B, bacterial
MVSSELYLMSMKPILKILKFTSELKWYYLIIAICSISFSLLSQSLPLLTKGIIDEVLKVQVGLKVDMKMVLILAGLVFLQDFLGTLISNFGGYFGDLTGVKMNKLLGERYYEHMLKMPQEYFDEELTGTITARLNRSVVELVQFATMFSNAFMSFIFSTIFALGFTFYYSWKVGLLFLVLYPIYTWMTMRSSAQWMTYQNEKNQNQDIAFGRFSESIGQVKVIKSFGQEARELKFFKKHLGNVVDVTKPQSVFWHKRDIERRIVLGVIFGLVYGVIGWQAARGDITPGTAILLIQFGAIIRIPIMMISWMVENVQKAVSNSRDYFVAMSLDTEMTDTSTKKLAKGKGSIVFEDVEFSYKNGQKVMKGVSFTAEHGQKVALVGESGEGKTTLTNLLMRLYQPSAGKISIDNQDINTVARKSLRDNIGVVFQDASLFSGTIRENIAYANPKASEAQVISAAKSANAHEFITKFDDGYDTMIGERGLKLSGGQKQRVAIARALLKDAPILVLDEATSSLDSKSEAVVQEALERLMKGRTTLIIAHRLSTIQKVDKIVTLSNGKVDEVGSPAELAKSGGIYAKLLSLQSGADEKSLKKFGLST